MEPKLYVALSRLKRTEWCKGTVYGSCVNTFELFLRTFMRGESGDVIGAHVALYFENATDEMMSKNADFERQPLFEGNRRSFFVDILDLQAHTISYRDDRKNWYHRWDWVKIEFYEVVDVTVEQILDAHASVLQILAQNSPYDFCINVNSLFPSFCCPCRHICLFVQPWAWQRGLLYISNGVNCISSVIVGLAAARGTYDSGFEEALGLSKRVVLGALLPSELVVRLIHSGVLKENPTSVTLSKSLEFAAVLPALLFISRL